jgi:lysophospholipase L1-like esterase
MHLLRTRATLVACLAFVPAVGPASGCARRSPAVQGGDVAWVGTWSAAPQLTEPRNMPPAPGLRGSTLRQVVHVSLGGPSLRLRLSNEFGDGPVTVSAAHLAESRGGGAIVPASDRALTFAGQRTVTIPRGGVAVSDPLAFALAPVSDVAVTMHLADVPGGVTGHPGSRTTSYLQAGDHRSAESMASASRTEHWYLIAGLDVARPRGAAVVVLGNSIADGRGSGTDRQNRWPDNLARRLQQEARTTDVAVLNAGIGGNCVLRECIGPAGVERLERDVLGQPGVRWLIVSEGVNDIGGARTADASAAVARDLVAAYGRMIERAHARGLRVYGATILPFGGSSYDTPEHEAARQTVNAWIRTGGAFDAVVDLDAAMRDPGQPTRLRADVDGGDHLHPNELGYRVMADAIDLGLFAR